MVDLVSDNRNLCKLDIEALINRCKAKAERVQVCPSSYVVASLCYEAMGRRARRAVWLWGVAAQRVSQFLAGADLK
ncbi:hypothetical protein M0R45_004987 [Rubus argutus]|uniref:Uncharacterized protein n=1 Tax=Rubus argutus TaxID=59490 RepID=A0AAW1YLE7_RUBAR